MYKCIGVFTETYQTSIDEFMVDVVDTPECYGAFLYRLGYGVKTLMFGVDKADTTKKEFLALIRANLATYVARYIEKYN